MHTVKLCLALSALLVGAATADSLDATDAALSAPTQRLSDVVPRAALDGLTLPDQPIRVASRPAAPKRPAKLDWRPTLKDAAEASEPQAEALTPIEKAPLLLPPNRDPAPAPTPQRPAAEPEAPAATEPAEEAVATDRAGDGAPAAAPEPKASAEARPTEAKPTEPTVESTPAEPAADAPATPPERNRLEQNQPQQAEPQQAKPKQAKPKQAGPKQAEPKQVQPEQTAPKATPPAPAKPLEPLSRGMRNLRSRLRTVLSFYYRQPFNTVDHDAWEIMHGMLAYELQSRVLDGGPRGKPMTAVGHLCFNRPSEGKRMLVLDSDGRLDVRVGVGLQGHKGQLLAMLAQCNVSPDYPLRVQGQRMTIRDLVEAEQRTCYARTELTFKLIGLGHYLDSDARWVNDQGEAWDIPRLIREEREQPIRGAACGGTHRLAGLSLAHRRREARGEPVDGEYAEAARFVAQYEQYAFRLQNPDGSLSTEWFRGRGAEEDIERRLRTTGHTLEWLAYSLSDEELRSYRTVRAATYLTNLLASNANKDWHPGSLSHALHALLLYDKRVFQPHDSAETLRVASAAEPTSRLFRGYPIYRGVMRNGAPEPSGFLGLFGGGSRSGSAASRRSR